MTDNARARALLENRPESLGRMFFDRVHATPDREAYRFPVGAGWTSVTWEQTGERVRRIAAGLIELGVEPEQRVAIAVQHPLRVDPGRPGDHVVGRCDHDRLSVQHLRRRGLHPRRLRLARRVRRGRTCRWRKLREHRAELPDLVAVVDVRR